MDDALYLAVLKYLGYRPRSEKEIRDYIQKKLARIKDSHVTENAETIMQMIIVKLKKQRFLNDEEFARMWVRSRKTYKPKGQHLIIVELQQKGISQDIITKVLEDSKTEMPSDLENAKLLLEKKRRKYESMEWQERFQKAGSMLARKGFSMDIIRKSIDEVFGK